MDISGFYCEIQTLNTRITSISQLKLRESRKSSHLFLKQLAEMTHFTVFVQALLKPQHPLK